MVEFFKDVNLWIIFLNFVVFVKKYKVGAANVGHEAEFFFYLFNWILFKVGNRQDKMHIVILMEFFDVSDRIFLSKVL